jgi:hypothetical protein
MLHSLDLRRENDLRSELCRDSPPSVGMTEVLLAQEVRQNALRATEVRA